MAVCNGIDNRYVPATLTEIISEPDPQMAAMLPAAVLELSSRSTLTPSFLSYKFISGAWLAVQWLGACLARSGTQVRSLVGELRFHVPRSNHIKGIAHDAAKARCSQINKLSSGSFI